MRTIYVGFSRPNKFKVGAWLIQKWMGTNYSHAYIRFESSSADIPISTYQAAHGMVHFLSFSRLKGSNIIAKEYAIDVPNEVRRAILIDCMNMAGEKYGYIELLNAAAYDIGHAVGLNIETKDNRGYICSELVGKILNRHLGITFNKPLHILSPRDIEKRLKQVYAI